MCKRRFGAIEPQTSATPQRMLHGNVRNIEMFDVDLLQKEGDEKFELAIKRDLEGHNMFISGQCGTRKTFLLRKYQDFNF